MVDHSINSVEIVEIAAQFVLKVNMLNQRHKGSQIALKARIPKLSSFRISVAATSMHQTFREPVQPKGRTRTSNANS